MLYPVYWTGSNFLFHENGTAQDSPPRAARLVRPGGLSLNPGTMRAFQFQNPEIQVEAGTRVSTNGAEWAALL